MYSYCKQFMYICVYQNKNNNLFTDFIQIIYKMLKLKKLKASDYAKQEFQKTLDKLPSYWREMLIEKYPQYGTSEGKSLISRVKNGVTTDMILVLKLKEIANEYQQKQSA